MPTKIKATAKPVPAKAAIRNPTLAARRKVKLAPPTPHTKSEIVLALLRRAEGASGAELAKATDWQMHSVRGFLSGTIRKKLSLPLLAERIDGVTRYRLAKRS